MDTTLIQTFIDQQNSVYQGIIAGIAIGVGIVAILLTGGNFILTRLYVSGRVAEMERDVDRKFTEQRADLENIQENLKSYVLNTQAITASIAAMQMDQRGQLWFSARLRAASLQAGIELNAPKQIRDDVGLLLRTIQKEEWLDEVVKDSSYDLSEVRKVVEQIPDWLSDEKELCLKRIIQAEAARDQRTKEEIDAKQ